MTPDARFMGDGWWAWRASAMVGSRQLRAMERAGLPASLHDPLDLLLTRQIAAAERAVLDRVESVREAFAARAGDAAVFDPDAEPRRQAAGVRPDEQRPERRSFSDTARITSVPPLWGMFLHRCARASGARTILELGTGAGISGCYLGSAPGCRRFITVEGSAERASLAEQHLRQVVPRFELVVSPFQGALDTLLPGLHDGLDCVFVDGNKTAGGYLELVDRFSPRLNRGALVVFDDIQWSGMRGDWRALAARRGFSFAVNTGRFGVCVWEGGDVRPKACGLFAIGGMDLYRMRRDLLARRT